jgi:hypothetical protein
MERPKSSNQTIWYTYNPADEERRYYFSPSLKVVTRINPTSRSKDFLVVNRQPLHHEMEFSAEEQAQPTQSSKSSKISREEVLPFPTFQYRVSLVVLFLYLKFVRFFTSPYFALWILVCNVCFLYTTYSIDNHQSHMYVLLPREWELLQHQYCVRNTTIYDQEFD